MIGVGRRLASSEQKNANVPTEASACQGAHAQKHGNVARVCVTGAHMCVHTMREVA